MAHIHEKLDFVISAFIVYEGRVLLVQHPRYDMWLPMGGHIELDEDSDQALFREIREETGLEVEIMSHKHSTMDTTTKPLYSPNYMEVYDANPPHRHISLTYFARAKNDNHILSSEHSEIRWLSESELDDPQYKLTDSIKFFCREALKLSKTF